MSAYDLIEKHFSNFPSKLIKSRKQPLMLMTKYKEVPIALENKLKEIFVEEDKYNSIKEELMNSPYGVSPTFFDLYDDLENKLDQTSEEESKWNLIFLNSAEDHKILRIRVYLLLW